MNKYIGIAGTNYSKSLNAKMLNFIKKHFAAQADIELLDISQWPLFSKVDANLVPEAVLKASQKIKQADGVIFATPEYDHSVPAVLMNALAWLSYLDQPFNAKPVLITGVSYGALGTSRAQEHLRKILNAPELGAKLMESQEFLVGRGFQTVAENGQLEASLLKELDQQFSAFETFVAAAKKEGDK